MTGNSALVEFERDGHVAILTLNRPEARNAISPELAMALEAAVDRVEEEHDIWAVVLRANTKGQQNPVFCAGADLKALSRGTPVTERGHFAGFVFRERSKPFVAAVDGMAVAGGVEIALACDIIVATTRSTFAMPEVTRNLFAGAGAVFRLPAALGKATAMDMLLTADPISAERAYALGLISRLVAPGEAEATALAVAKRITENAPIAVQWTRRVVQASEELDYQSLRELNQEASHVVASAEDKEEGIRAFVEKRKPNWAGR